ncbi:hypothetical protein OG897_31000 [Streptomyces sp. NBC_00237]|uniref:hypothetical protein n=1 Tax=Streptomyces sp. NBC_00237 TaxID=2975687 RepID=UPI002256A6A2|nr:hypothetical protein [Streptomyces sp. NBC_00237]MCX5205849.1 hypothetical protein [Streptomyces sp. NBC_00237]
MPTWLGTAMTVEGITALPLAAEARDGYQRTSFTMRTVRDLPGNVRGVTLTRRYRSTQVEVTSQTLDQPGLRHVLDSLHPLTEATLKKLTREKGNQPPAVLHARRATS